MCGITIVHIIDTYSHNIGILITRYTVGPITISCMRGAAVAFWPVNRVVNIVMYIVLTHF